MFWFTVITQQFSVRCKSKWFLIPLLIFCSACSQQIVDKPAATASPVPTLERIVVSSPVPPTQPHPTRNLPPIAYPPPTPQFEFLATAYPYPAAVTPTLVPTTTPEPPTPTPTQIPYPEFAGLTYQDGANLWQIQADGIPKMLIDEPYGQLSPDGQQLLYTSDEEIWIANIESSERKNITNTAQRRECCAYWWSANPDIILLKSTEIPYDDFSPHYLTALNLTNGDYHILDAENSTAFFSASPDGNYIAYDNGRIYDWQQKNSTQLQPTDYGLPEQSLGSPAWSPQGDQLAWTAFFREDDNYQYGTAVLNLQEQSGIGVHFFMPIGGDGHAPSPQWHPDGEWLAIPAFANNVEEAGLWILPRVGQPGDEFRLEPDAGFGIGRRFAWSPDGKYLAATLPPYQEPRIFVYTTGTWQAQELFLNQSGHVSKWVEVGEDEQ